MQFNRKLPVIMAVMSATLALSACGEKTKESLGLARRTPDAFAVVTRAPLELPPDYTLRPPVPGAERPQEVSTVDQAEKALLGNAKGPKTQSKAESELLNKSGADQVPDNIRAVISAEQGDDVDDKTPIGKKLLGLGSAKEAGVIDPVAEKKRLDSEKPKAQAAQSK